MGSGSMVRLRRLGHLSHVVCSYRISVHHNSHSIRTRAENKGDLSDILLHRHDESEIECQIEVSVGKITSFWILFVRERSGARGIESKVSVLRRAFRGLRVM